MKPVVICLVSARRARGLDEDEAPLATALRAAGAHVEIADWDDPGVSWGSFDLAILRSTWDYTERLTEFLAWARRVDGLTRLVNPAAVVCWNTDKHYLSELTEAGVPTVPSAFVEPGDSAAESFDRFTCAHSQRELVVKPAVGAGSRDARRYERDARDEVIAHAKRLLEAGRSVVFQPYLERVDDYGETALIYLGGRFSHAIRKGPMLSSPDRAPPRTERDAGSALFVPERISSRAAAADELAAAAKALQAVPFGDLLYARVDLIRDALGAPVLLELELTEPSLFFAYAEGSAARLADLALGRVGRPKGS